MSEQENINPELGDFITILSDQYTNTTGRIVYRNDKLIRIRPVHSLTVVDFPLTEEGLFDPITGVQELIIKEKRTDPHYSKQLNLVLGDEIELFDTQGQSIGIVGTVSEIIATEDMDAIRFENGKYLNFQFVGPKVSIGFIVPHTSIPLNEEETTIPSDIAEPVPDFDFNPNIVIYEEAEEDQFTYSDAVQRHDMFTAFMDDVPTKRQKDPKLIQSFFRLTDVFLSLKNSIVMRDESGSLKIGSTRSYIADTVQDTMAKQPPGSFIGSILPVANVKKVLYLDSVDEQLSNDNSDIVFKDDLLSLYNAQLASEKFAKSQTKEAGFLPYIYSLSKAISTYEPVGIPESFLEEDQDVLRSQIPPTDVDGFPIVPPFERKGEIQLLKEDSLGKITNRYVRLLGPSRTKLTQKTERKTSEVSFVVANADSADTVGHIILSNDLLPLRQPIRSSILLWDIVASERSRRASHTFYDLLMKHWTSQRVMMANEDPIPLMDIVADRLEPALSMINPNYTSVLDSLGLRNLEISEKLYTYATELTHAAQTEWDTAFKALKAQNRQETSVPIFANIVSLGSPLFSISNQSFVEQLRLYNEKYSDSTLKESDISLAQELHIAGNYSFYPLWHALVSENQTDRIPILTMEYQSEMNRIQNTMKNMLDANKMFVATPKLNSCKHVKQYEQICRVKDEENRMMLLAKYLKSFNGGIVDNYVMCNICKQDLMCKHEMLLLNEFFNIGKKELIHKAILLEFAGPVFEGNYICKVCGQKIRELEYATSIEFTDDGKPLVGRSVLEDTDTDEIGIVMREEIIEKRADFPFKDAELAYYYIMKASFEACGLEIDMEKQFDIYTRTVRALGEYSKYLPSEQKYDKGRKAEYDKIKGEKKKQEFAKQFPPYAEYYSNALIGCIGALTVLEIQTSSIAVPNPTSGCLFQRSGRPFSDQGTGTIEYVSCSYVLKKITSEPWNSTSWSLESSEKKVMKNIQFAIENALDWIFLKKVGALSGITETYSMRIANMQTSIQEDLASMNDVLPASYRPLQQLRNKTHVSELGNTEIFQKNIKTNQFHTIGPKIEEMQRSVNEDIMRYAHSLAKKDTVPFTNNPRSDSSCCFKRLNTIRTEGCGYQSLPIDEAERQEIEVLKKSHNDITQSDPTRSANGTHIYVPWSSPIQSNPVPEVDASILYKLFLKFCFRGAYMGFPHEIGTDSVCRRCKFVYPAELKYFTSSEISETNPNKLEKSLANLMNAREQIILSRFQEQGVVMNIETFRELEAYVRMRKVLKPVEQTVPIGFLERLDAMDAHIELVGYKEDWTLFKTTLRSLYNSKITDPLRRRIAFAPFSGKYDALFKKVQMMWNDIQIMGKEKPRIASANVDFAKESFEMMMKGTVGAGIRNAMNVFVVGAEQIAQGYTNLKPKSKKWFPKINRNHAVLLDDIWTDYYEVANRVYQIVGNLEDPVRLLIQARLRKFNAWLGKWLKIWLNDMKPTKFFTDEEFFMIIKWSIVLSMEALLREDSYFYDGEVDENATASTIILNRWLLDALQSNKKIVNTYYLSDAEIENAIFAREEKERNFFINKIDVLDGEMRKIELMKKQLKLGDWNVSSKNLFSYNRDWWEHEREQRAAMGIVPGFGENVTNDVQPDMEPIIEANPFENINDHRGGEDEDV